MTLLQGGISPSSKRITGHLARVAGEMEVERTFSKIRRGDHRGLCRPSIARTFRALSHKYLLTGRDTGVFFGSLID